MPIAAEASARALRALAARAPVIPVLTLERAEDALPVGRALAAGGLPVIEVTLRTPAALGAITALATLPGVSVGAGTLRTAADVAAAREAGAAFGVSPGATERLLAAALAEGLPLLPGAATPSEAMRLAEAGHDFLKFFPAAAAGGHALLAALAAPLPDIAFCPTGGIGAEDARAWLALPNVLCVGGSWVAPPEAVAARDWAGIEARAHAAALSRAG